MRYLLLFFGLFTALGCEAQVARSPIYAAPKGQRDGAGISYPNAAHVASHRYDADVAWNSNTDVFAFGGDKRDWFFAETAHFRFNLGGTCFERVNVSGGNWTDRQNVKRGGRFGFGLYFDMNTWNEVDTAVLRSLVKVQKDSLSAHGSITAMSYANGDTSGVFWLRRIKVMLGGRNSFTDIPTTAKTSIADFYGLDYLGGNLGNNGGTYNAAYTHSRRSVARFNNDGGWGSGDSTAMLMAIDSAASMFASVITRNGFFNNFTHYHGLYQSGSIERRSTYHAFLAKQRQKLTEASALAYSESYGAILEYSWARRLVSGVTTSDNGTSLTVAVSYTDIPEINRNLISVPVTISLSTTGTSLASQEISCSGCVGIRKIATSTFALDVNIPANLATSTLTITPTGSPSYYDFTLPTVVSATYSAPNLTVTTNIPTRLSVFYGPRNGLGPWDIQDALRSGFTYTTSHVINISGITPSTKDIYLGLITAANQSSLSTVQRF